MDTGGWMISFAMISRGVRIEGDYLLPRYVEGVLAYVGFGLA